VTGMNVMKMRK